MLRTATLLLLLAVAACSEATPATTTTTTAATTTTTVPTLPPPLEGWATTRVVLSSASGDERLLVAVADDEPERQHGLMNVADLADLDGMLFVFDGDTTVSFWMQDTLIPLDIAFFAADGRIVDALTMEPCRESPCPLYAADGPYRFAVEVAAGRFSALEGDVRLAFTE